MFLYCFILASMALASHGAATSRDSTSNLYFLYNQRTHSQTPETILATEEGVKASDISFELPTIILVHSHEGTAFTSLNPVVKDAILNVEDVNLIVMDWSTYASLPYSTAVGIIPTVAENLVTFIQLLIAEVASAGIVDGNVVANDNIDVLENLHLIGFGLGAHLVGVAGRLLDGKVARITGLDPSGRLWGSNSNRLRASDAIYVEVIHTDGSGLHSNGIGEAVGDIDFFANGGSSQPGCITHACCHDRAFELFAASMENKELIGYPCSSNTQLNLNLCRGTGVVIGGTELSKIGSSGIYRVNTRRRWPF